MKKNKKTWDEKIKLILNELEGKISEEKVRKEKNSSSQKSDGKKPRTEKKYRSKKEWKKAEFRREIMSHAVMSAAFILATVALIQGIVKVLPDSVTVSNTVNGRELPIYCVQTEKPQIALSFDAAWGNS